MKTSKWDAMVHEYGERWVVALWDERQAQYVGGMPRGAQEQGYRYTYGRTLQSIVRLGVPTYATRAGALAAARRIYQDD